MAEAVGARTESGTRVADRPAPYLSIVACSRNDGHGGHLLERMQLFIDGIADQVGRFGIDCELVLVDWNPPPNVPGLADALRYPDGGGHMTSRVITVPPELHSQLANAASLPLFQMIAKNVGIRRARGAMVLSTNIDILFPDAVFAWLADGNIDERRLYRTDRADVLVTFEGASGADLPLLRAAPAVRTNRRGGVYDAAGRRSVPMYTGLIDCIADQLRSRLGRSAGARLPITKAAPTSSHGTMQGLLRAAAKTWRMAILLKPPGNASGDFTLMSRDRWDLLAGYAEWAIYSWNLDALLIYQALSYGIPVVELPQKFTIRHMEHANGSGWTPLGSGDLFKRLAAKGVPVFDDDALGREAEALGATIIGRRRPRRYNGSDWGMAGFALPERRFPQG